MLHSTLPRTFLCTLVTTLLAAPARADLTDWLAEVASGTPATYVDINILAPTTADIGSLSPTGGVSYEFIVNATNAGISSALMGARGTGVGDSGGLKFEQYADSLNFGITDFGVADYFYGPNTENVDLHVVFVADTTTGSTQLFVDTVSLGAAPYTPVLSGVVGIAQALDPTGAFDPLVGTIHGVAVYDALLGAAEIQSHFDAYSTGTVGMNYCGPAIPNSTGQAAHIYASGSSSVPLNNLSLTAEGLPAGEFGYFLVSRTQGFLNPPGSQGILCLVGNIGRYNQTPNIIQGPTGTILLDLTSVPVNPPAAVLPGDTFSFQCWFRDNNPGLTSNFTDGLVVLFQ